MHSSHSYIQQQRDADIATKISHSKLRWLVVWLFCSLQIWLKELKGGDYALTFVNTTNSSAAATAARAALAQAGGSVSIAVCNDRDSAQQWNLTEAGGMVAVGSSVRTDGTKQQPAHCLEIDGCGYTVGAHVDTSYSCKSLPKPAGKDKCAANMAWKLSKGGALQTVWDPTLCFEVVGSGSLATCDNSRGQQWTAKGEKGAQQLVSGTGFGCLSNGPPKGGPPISLTFDVVGLGWKTAVAVDLWSGAKTTQGQIVVTLPQGDGSSKIFRLTKSS